jgi:betaine-aldehyde dehydrogenase
VSAQIEVVNPANERVLARIPCASSDQVDEVVRRAGRAAPGWSAVEPAKRAALLRSFATAIDAELDELAKLESLNVGKPLTSSRAEVAGCAEVLEYYAGAIDKHHGATIPVAGGVDMTFHEPLGVVAAIVPWNFPLNTAITKLAPALACGNAVILKPSELAPLTTSRLPELAQRAGLPADVVQVVNGFGRPTGEALVRHPGVAKVAFTGSSRTGAQVMAACAESLTPVTLELGGKSANVVFADADLPRAAREACDAGFDNAGQDCCARSRILVDRRIYDDFTELLRDAAGRIRVGPPDDPAAEMGPLISEAQRERVRGYVNGAAPLLFQGQIPAGPGFWFPPTLIGPVDNNAPVAQDEIFGPVMCVVPFEHEEDAIRLANATRYGLSGSVWTRDAARALRVARRIRTGVLSVNSNRSVFVATPFGGVKESGFGREGGMAAMNEYSAVKNVYLATE